MRKERGAVQYPASPETVRATLQYRLPDPRKETVKTWTEENKAFMRRYLDELVATNYINHDPAIPDLPSGPEGLKPIVAAFRSGFHDIHVTIEDQIAEADKVVTRFILQGTHQGNFMGVLATGKQMTVAAITIERLAGGKLVEHWRQSDVLGMMQQLGVIPTSGQGGSPA